MIGYINRSPALNAMAIKALLCLLCCLLFTLSACSSRPLNHAQPEHIQLNLGVNQTQTQLQIEATLKAQGQRQWLKPDHQDLIIINAHGDNIVPSSLTRTGVSTFSLNPREGPFKIHVRQIIQQPIPILTTPDVTLKTSASSPWQINDSVQLILTQPTDQTHYVQWVLRCGDQHWRFDVNLDPQQTQVELNLSALWQQLEQSTGARVTGTAQLDLEVFTTPNITPEPQVTILQWRQLWQYSAQLQSPRSGAQISGALRLGTSNFSLGVQSTPIKACR